jgi:hypothetical protein
VGLGLEGWLRLREFLGGEDIDVEDSNSALQSESSSLHSVDVSHSRVGVSLLINFLSLTHSLTLSLSKNRQTDTDRFTMRASGCIIGCKAAGKPPVNSGVAELKYAGPILKSERGRK